MGVGETADGNRMQIGAAEYRTLRRASETYRAELVLRLGGEVGLRPAEITRIRPDHVRNRDHDGAEHYFLTVPESDAETRLAYLPEDVEHDLRQYARAEDVAADERLIPVTPRRVQMLVSEVADRAADRTGEDRFREVSSQTLRQYFARHLVKEWVDPRVVQAVGGWERIESLAPYLEEPEPDDIAAAFARSDAIDSRLTDAETATAENGSGQPSLARLDRIIDGLRNVGEGLTTASTREEVERTTCERLVGVGCYQFAWFAQREGDGFRPVAVAGLDTDAVDELAVADGAAGTALSEDRVLVSSVNTDDAFAPWREYDADAAAVIPVDDGDSTYGVLGIGAAATGDISDRERTLLADLGARVGQAITAAEQRKFLLADTSVELTFECRNPDSFFAGASARFDGTLSMEGVVPGEERSLLYFVTLADAQPDAVVEWAPTTEAVTDARLVRDYGEEALLELVVDGPDLSKTLVEHGATIREIEATAGRQEVVGEVPANASVRDIVDDVTATFPGTDLSKKRERELPAESLPAFRSSLRENLTEKQAAVLQAAYHAGYFEWPRGSTAEELADAIGITSPTLHNHLRRAQQKLLSTFYDQADHHATDMPWTDE
ncbi:bacterio-opsin activator domain-containing protein [Halorientalis salina]|uniref:bacterio-opsin activator domain-containing protein n=1 Tax=Halorientalis salina TaxID=2932266 RepID=UPI0010AD46FF|nr:bacterio-opsin activator domain-containing protein [Halorientalis salina]